MKKIILSVASLAIVFTSCSDDDDSTGGELESSVTAAVISGGPYEFCVDGLVDNIADSDLVIEDAGTGSESSFVVTNVEGDILGLPGMASGPDFDGAGVGMCYMYHINYEEGLEGLTGPDMGVPTSNISDLVGDYELSNFVTVDRQDCALSVVAATLVAGDSATDGQYTFTVDGVADNITDLIVEDAGTGINSNFVVTDVDGWVLGLPAMASGPDFDAAGAGVCYLRHLNYDGDASGLTGPDMGVPTSNISDLEGSDFKLSNIIIVNRLEE